MTPREVSRYPNWIPKPKQRRDGWSNLPVKKGPPFLGWPVSGHAFQPRQKIADSPMKARSRKQLRTTHAHHIVSHVLWPPRPTRKRTANPPGAGRVTSRFPANPNMKKAAAARSQPAAMAARPSAAKLRAGNRLPSEAAAPLRRKRPSIPGRRARSGRRPSQREKLSPSDIKRCPSLAAVSRFYGDT
jgi:hypothetical protein